MKIVGPYRTDAEKLRVKFFILEFLIDQVIDDPVGWVNNIVKASNN